MMHQLFLLLLIAPKQKNFCVTKDRVPLRGLAEAGPRIVCAFSAPAGHEIGNGPFCCAHTAKGAVFQVNGFSFFRRPARTHGTYSAAQTAQTIRASPAR